MRGGSESLLHVPLDIPEPGCARSVQKGSWQVVVERNGEGLQVLAHNGRRARRWTFAVPQRGRMELWVRAPRFPVRVHFEELLTLAPRGQVLGHVAIPLPMELMSIGANGQDRALAELLPPELQTAWLGEERGYVHEVRSRFAPELASLRAEGVVLVPLELSNARSVAVSPTSATVDVRTSDLRVVGSRIVSTPRAVALGEASEVTGRLGGRA